MSADARTVVFAPRGSAGYGGPLYLLDTSDGKTKRLTRGAYFGKARPDEVYSDPDLSPDGKQAVFAIHSASKGDAVEASGPFAIVDVLTERVHLLESTMHLPITGVAFANDPHWSPDGSRILLNFEADAALIEPSGSSVRALSGLLGPDNEWSHGVGWLGPQCVVYIAGTDPNDAEKRPAQLLNLKTVKSQPLADAVDALREESVGLVAISASVLVRKDGDHLRAVTRSGKWGIPGSSDDVQVRVINHDNDGWIPQSCR
jgi:hypothetical protein